MSEQPRSGSYALRATPTVRRALAETLPEAVAAAAYEFSTGPLLEQPHHVGKRLLPPLDDRFSARRGTYRIIYRIDDQARMVPVADIGHQRRVPNLKQAATPLTGHRHTWPKAAATTTAESQRRWSPGGWSTTGTA
jgi:mRNA interferase RelE/StbE